MDHLELPGIAIEALPEFVLRLPMPVAVTIENRNPEGTFSGLRGCDLLSPAGGVEFRLVPPQGQTLLWPAESARMRENPFAGFTLGPGEVRRMLFDLSVIDPSPRPGRYRLEATLFQPLAPAEAPPLELTFVEPPNPEAAVVSKLRAGHASWAAFVLDGGPALPASLPQGLGLHRFLREAVHGPRPIASLDPEDAARFAPGPLEGEAAVLRVEILSARGDPRTAEESGRILRRWPGLRWRLDEISRGEGLLTRLRQWEGAEAR